MRLSTSSAFVCSAAALVPLTSLSAVGQCGDEIIRSAELDGSNGFRIVRDPDTPLYAYAGPGFSVAGGGDLNGDGIADIVVHSEYGEDGPPAFVLYGRAGGNTFSAEMTEYDFNGNDGTILFDATLRVIAEPIGDVNNDGIQDISVRTYYGSSRYIVFGRDASSPFPANASVADYLDGAQGFEIINSDSTQSLGVVHRAGDLNGDGIDDLLVNNTEAQSGDPEIDGQVFVVYGRDASETFPSTFDVSSIDGTNGFAFNGTGSNPVRGAQPIGDVNGDGVDDVYISRGRTRNVGHVIFGRDQSNPFPAAVQPAIATGGFRLTGASWLAEPVGDVNDDGTDDFLMTSSNWEAFLLFGRPESGPFPNVVHIPDLGVGEGVEITGIDYPTRIDAAGDFNGDGIADLVITDYIEDAGNVAEAGAVYVIFGRPATDPFSATFDASQLDGSNGVMVHGPAANARFGFDVSQAGDLNSDGYDDIVVGARSFGAYIIFGRPNPDPVPALADTNGDGQLTPADFNAWILAFNSNGPACDQNGDAVCTPGDFNAWILNFNTGC
ncbi:MAG: integrin alpha [Planctomycetota bacterium]